MADQMFRLNLQAACATCGDEWFGKGGEALARRHASESGHQVHIQTLMRETLNLVAVGAEPDYAPLVTLAPSQREHSVTAAKQRVSLFENAPVAKRHGIKPRHVLSQRAAS